MPLVAAEHAEERPGCLLKGKAVLRDLCVLCGSIAALPLPFPPTSDDKPTGGSDIHHPLSLSRKPPAASHLWLATRGKPWPEPAGWASPHRPTADLTVLPEPVRASQPNLKEKRAIGSRNRSRPPAALLDLTRQGGRFSQDRASPWASPGASPRAAGPFQGPDARVTWRPQGRGQAL